MEQVTRDQTMEEWTHEVRKTIYLLTCIYIQPFSCEINVHMDVYMMYVCVLRIHASGRADG